MTEYTLTPTISKSVSMEEESYQNGTSTNQRTQYLDHKPESLPSQTRKPSVFVRFSNTVGLLRLELVAFLLTFSYVLPKITSTSMILEKVCLAHFNYPPSICNNLANYSDLKPPITRLANNYQLGHTLIQTAPAAILSCFIGPWSDNYGRKLPVVIAITGLTLDTLGSSISAHFLNSRVEYYYIPALFSGFSGGIVTLLAIVYSYASDLTSYNKRTIRYALIELATGLAIPAGVASGGWIYNFLGYPAVYLFSTGGIFACLLCVLFLLPETRGIDRNEPFTVKIKEMFSFKTFKESFLATTKKRPHNGKKQIILLIVSMCFVFISTNSTSDVNFLYVHHQFNWGNTKYSTISAIYSICAVVLLVIIVPLFMRIRIKDSALGLVGTTSLLAKYIGLGLSFKEGIFHIANLLGLLSTCAPLAIRSRISKVVSNDDLGKVFTFVATAESLLPILSTALVAQIFNIFLTVYPGMPYIFLAIFLIVPFTVFTWLACMPQLTYEEIHGKIEHQRETYAQIET